MIIGQYYQLFVSPSSMVEYEYQIPNPPSRRPFRADMANLSTHGLYEIKKYTQAAAAVEEVARYAINARLYCEPENMAWHGGIDYPPYAIIPWGNGKVLETRLFAPGVITYREQNIPQWQPLPVPEQIPELRKAPRPKPVLDKIRHFIEYVIESGVAVEEAVAQFLRENPDVRNYLIGAAVAIILFTIIEDILTLGAGLLDDPASFLIARALIRAAYL